MGGCVRVHNITILKDESQGENDDRKRCAQLECLPEGREEKEGRKGERVVSSVVFH